MSENNGTQDTETSNRNVDGANANVYLAALRATAPLAPVLAVALTVLVYVALGETGISEKIEGIKDYAAPFLGASAVFFGFVAAIFIWLIIALFSRRYTAADAANRRNYNMLREKLNRLRSRLDYACPESFESQGDPTNPIGEILRNKACDIASREWSEIEIGLKSRGMPWVTGIGYIELWHRVHRAEEALIKVEPTADALGAAMRDESRLENSTIRNKDLLLERLRCAVAMLDDSDTGSKYLSYLAKSTECPLPKEERAIPENRQKALTVLSEVRYEINNFRDNVWEGLINARNRLADTSAVLGFAAYSLLALAIFMNVPYSAIVWVVAYFLVGALAGLFARSQAEWTTDTAVDDFGLSTARLLHVPWLSGLAAVGGVLVTSLADALVANNAGSSSELTVIFGSKPFLLIVAAVFGLTPDLLIRRLTQQAEKYKEDLRSTQSSQSITSGTDAESAQLRRPGMQPG